MTSHKDVAKYLLDMQGLRNSYHLNGAEVQQVYMQSLGIDWHKVSGNWSPFGTDGRPLAHDDDVLTQRVAEMHQRITEKFRSTANFTEMGRMRQGEDEPFEDFRIRFEKVFRANSGIIDDCAEGGSYQQHLKSHLHNHCAPRVRDWVEKHVVGLGRKTLEDYVDQAIDADKVTKRKKQRKEKESQKADTFWGECDKEEDIYYHGDRGRGYHRGRGRRGRGRGRSCGRGQDGYWNKPGGRGCWSCGKEGHLARDCPENKQNQA